MRTRIRKGLAVTAVVAGVFMFAAPAFAQEEAEPEFADHAAEECYEILAEGGKVDDCQEAPNPLLPETNEVIWGSAAFAVLLLAMWKWGVPAVKNMMQAREDRIRTDLERAESAKTEADQLLEQYRAQLADARNEAGRLIEEARQAAEQVRRDLVARAEAEASEIRARAQEDARLAAERAMAELRERVGELAIQLAEKIVERNLDRETQMALVNSYIDQVASR